MVVSNNNKKENNVAIDNGFFITSQSFIIGNLYS